MYLVLKVCFSPKPSLLFIVLQDEHDDKSKESRFDKVIAPNLTNEVVPNLTNEIVLLLTNEIIPNLTNVFRLP
jgi:hypothetical protein